MSAQLGTAARAASPHAAGRATIDPAFSVYLDAVRFLAALVVVLSHSAQFHLYRGWVPLVHYAHDAVIVFFVLSGLVISATAVRPGETWQKFAIDRSARIYSVTIPAILLCYGLAGLSGLLGNGAVLREIARAPFAPAEAVTFLLQSWHFGALPWNAPYWSLCYEVWYYAMFGFIFFGSGRRALWLAALAGLIAGPAILVLFPLWLLGVWIMRHRLSLTRLAAWAAIIASAAGIYVITGMQADTWLRHFLHDNVPSYWKLHDSQQMFTDYLVALLVTLNFVSVRAILREPAVARWVLKLKKPITWAAGYTFSLYLFHYPLVRFCEVHFPNRADSLWQYLAVMTGIFVVIFLLGSVTEKKKNIVRALVQRMSASIASRVPKLRRA